MHRCQNQSISLQDTDRNRAQIPGLSTFNPFSDENAFQVDTKTRLGSKFLPGIWTLFLLVSLAVHAMVLTTMHPPCGPDPILWQQAGPAGF